MLCNVMRIAFCYPPIPSDKGVPLLSQNRQFQWFSRPMSIYPVVPACAASLMKQRGHAVLWLDGIVRSMTPEAYWKALENWGPEAVFLETKTPVVKFHLAWASELKRRLPSCIVIFAGDHATARPQDITSADASFRVLRGGHYDLALDALLSGREAPDPTSRADLSRVPRIDRSLTHWRDYAFLNGNFLRTPGAYIMSARDCWHGRCTFCSWTTLFPCWSVRPVEDVLDEIGQLIALGAREIMDDAGTLPTGRWLHEFCEGMIARGYARRVRLNCNMRFGALTAEEYRLMRRAGFRLVLFGVESANQSTLNRLNKQLRIEAVTEGARLASQAGLDVHVTLMFGYPWENYEAALQTAELGRWLLRRGWAQTLQATWLVPYPGTPLFRELQATGQLLTTNWEDYDMRSPVMRSPLTDAQIRALVAYAYRGHLQPAVLLRRVLWAFLHPADALRFAGRALTALRGHLKDFEGNIS